MATIRGMLLMYTGVMLAQITTDPVLVAVGLVAVGVAAVGAIREAWS
jgi:hypothetical protein